VEVASRQRGADQLDLALLTDGLRAERQQGITIDVAYRYFETARRKFIIADTPGHVQYTRNMVTGVSNADLAVILVDARNGITPQSRRHAVLASLLRVPHLVLCVNKMDLVDWSEVAFDAIQAQFSAFAARLNAPDLVAIPVSALYGDNVVTRSARMPWYEGAPLLYHLEHVHVGSDRNLIDPRFPVQWIVRPRSDEHHDYRGYAGQVAGGVFRTGDEVVVLPTGLSTRITRIDTFDGPVPEAYPPMSVTLHLADDIDVSRGDMICRLNNVPTTGQDIDAMLYWMTEAPMRKDHMYVIKHTTRSSRAVVRQLRYRLDTDTLHRDPTVSTLTHNEVGRVLLRATSPLFYDEHRRNRTTGSFILIDPVTNATAGGGTIL
jgi:bifunctional enzyme CysN/CysC